MPLKPKPIRPLHGLAGWKKGLASVEEFWVLGVDFDFIERTSRISLQECDNFRSGLQDSVLGAQSADVWNYHVAYLLIVLKMILDTVRDRCCKSNAMKTSGGESQSPWRNGHFTETFCACRNSKLCLYAKSLGYDGLLPITPAEPSVCSIVSTLILELFSSAIDKIL